MLNYARLPLAAAACLLPFSMALAASSTPAASNAPGSSCIGDASQCPAWMPSQAEMRSSIADYFCELADQGLFQPRVKQLIRAESSPLNCGALQPEPGSNFVCGGEMRFIGKGGEIHRIQFSPTLRREQDGRIAFYVGDDEHAEHLWRVPAPRSSSPTCAPHG
ncbi:hypothetical protein [Pseudoxanthomonas dokdonensis]|uniref:Uncharacterized protein n=1 Tax=Pseudoxanthomonas dokdonensis TaxID=344882 RepID=A0A0R0CXT1_9GAMM|nr:hypothetical protein [Pseudoxanthomonas dokdonensis]KRG70596.1 hypothetical protein ABB29_05910 [Pseudoxanthomonas dokdonensis]